MYRFLISGGGTGGHIFPAVSIANQLKLIYPDCEILFIGAQDRMEMERVPQAGYNIVGLPIKGFDRRNLLRNIPIMWNLLRSIKKAYSVVKDFKPDVAIGVGGYASGAAMKVAAWQSVPVLLQEQNGFAGVTNKLLKSDAATICVAYPDMQRFFPKDKIVLTGNPVRQNLQGASAEEALQHFGFTNQKPVLLVIGGSLGAKTINQAVMQALPKLLEAGIQVLWQTGKTYIEQAKQSTQQYACQQLVVTDFIARMDLAYAMADLVVSRAGASSISEICLLAKPAILVPSPNVAEDHQTHNAMALVTRDAAVMVKDSEALQQLEGQILMLIKDKPALQRLSLNAKAMAQTDSAERIVQEIQKLLPH